MESILSPHWYKVAQMRPALRAHVSVHRQTLGRRVSYVLQDRVTGKHHRFGEEAYELVRRMDGAHSLEEIWREATGRLGQALPTQGETMRLLAQLLRADLVHCDDKRLAEVLDMRRAQSRSRRAIARLAAPLSIRVPLVDPDRFLARTLPLVAPLLGRAGFLLWCLLVGAGALLAALKFPALASNLSDRLFSVENALLLWALYPLIKLVHELGHAWLIKRWGGEVHDLGVLLLVFFPVPYVDASASMAFEQRHRRVMVAAIGVMVELAIAAVAMIVWALAEPGLLRSVAFSTLLVAGVSSLLFNGNPLMRYDAYYVLAESVNQPALDRNGARRFAELVVRALGGRDRATALAEYSPRERAGMLAYVVLSFCYRTTVMLAIALLMVRNIPFFGVPLAAMVAISSLLMPLVRLLAAFRRARVPGTAVLPGRLVAFVALVAALLFLAPVALTTTVQGVVMTADETQVRAAADGLVTAEFVASGERVAPGQRLLRLRDDELDTAAALARARRDEVLARIAGAVRNPAEKDVLAEEAAYVERQVAQVERRLEGLDVRAQVGGTWFPVFEPTLLERHFARGDLLGHVVDPSRLRLLAVIDEDHILPVRESTVAVAVRGASAGRGEHPTRMLRLMPSATHELPHASLTTEGGGAIARNPEAHERLEAIRKFFWVELDLTAIPDPCLDCRAEIRFEHPPEPLAFRWGRWLRRQFLGLLND